MNRINFYANNDVLEFLQGLSYDFDHETVDLSVDFVNIVATLRLSNTDTGWEFSLIKRIEGLGNDEESGISLGKILVDKATRTGQLDSSQVNENECYALFDIVKNLGCYIQENNILANKTSLYLDLYKASKHGVKKNKKASTKNKVKKNKKK